MIERVTFLPLEGTFDLAPIQEYLGRLPDVVLDPHGTGHYMFSGTPEMAKIHRLARLNDRSRFPYTGLLHVQPTYIAVMQGYTDAESRPTARTIVAWMLEHYRNTRIQDGYGQDWTERVARDGVDILYRPGLVNPQDP
jgi:hypothetical protein